MKVNEGIVDRIIRALLAALVAVLIIMGVLVGTWAIILGIVGGILLITAITGFCGLYALIGVKTCPAKTKKA